MAPSLDDLLQTLKDLDHEEPTKRLLGKSFHLSKNASLGFPQRTGDLADFHVGMPFHQWPKPGQKVPEAFESSLAIAFRDTLDVGIDHVRNYEHLKSQGTPIIDDSKHVFIDISMLHDDDWPIFWIRRHGGNDYAPDCLAQRFGDAIDNIPKDLTPVIRFVFGGPRPISQQRLLREVQEVFWHDDKCIIKHHTKAQLFVGYYSPSFGTEIADGPDLKVLAKLNKQALDQKQVDDIDALDQLINPVSYMVERVRDFADGLSDELRQKITRALHLVSKDSLLAKIYSQPIPSIGWNHAKILAVHGQTVMTGGGNFWKNYADNVPVVSDLQCKIIGGAAESAHAYCNYVWEYLNAKPTSDPTSYHCGIPLSPGSRKSWSTGQVSLYKAPTNDVWSDGAYKVLAVSKLGDWTGPNKGLRYPIQIVDAMRDLLLNIAFRKIYTHVRDHPRAAETVVAGVNDRIANDVIAGFGSVIANVSDADMRLKLQEAGVSSAAWASRIARNRAVHLAEEVIYLDCEIIACFLQEGHKDWKTEFLDPANSHAELNKKDAWDGILWPYDLIQELARFMRGDTPKGEPRKLNILLTAKDPPKGPYHGWGDKVSAWEFRERIRLMDGWKDDNTFDTWFKTRCEIKRINDQSTMFNHNKVYCIDKKLLYVGSDNPYPNYNEEFGVWIDHEKTIQKWIDNSWTPRWDAVENRDKLHPDDGIMPHTM